jgi:DNA-binding response OmpR family regulator
MSTDTKTVLIVEDDLILNLLYESFMEKMGFETHGELVYGKTAVDMTKKISPDLILMDITLEGEMNGIEAMQKVREFSDVPVIFITGNSDPEHRKKAIETSNSHYLIKPVEFEDLKGILSEIGLA